MSSLLPPPTSPVLSGVQPIKPVEPEQKRRAFGDSAAARQAVFDQTLAAAESIKPRTNARHTLELADVDYTGPDRYTLAQQKAAILEGRSLGRKLRGVWRLRDNATGDVLDEKPATLATVPYMTDRGTFINNGVEYTVSNQMRLRPGVFSRVKNNGEIEAHVNVLPGEGRSHRYHLDPAKSVFYANIDQAKIPLLPLLRAMGADDKQLREAWGPDILAANLQNDNPAQLAKFFEKFLPKDSQDKDDLDKK
jgi:DNA-directed RNA polymerase beta subunit